MTSRERFLETLLFGEPDKIPFEPGQPREKTLLRWQQEGLSPAQDWRLQLCQRIGVDPEATTLSEVKLVNFRMNPTFAEKVLEHRDGHFIVQDWMGNITEISDEYDLSYLRSPKDFVTRKWHRFPVTNRQDFAEMKKRYDPQDPARYPTDFDHQVERLKQREHLVTVDFSGVFWQLREWCGFEPLCRMLVEDQDFFQEMAEFWMDFVSQTMARILACGIVDRIYISEDMAYKEKSMISPAMTRKFLLPAWSQWIRQAKQAGVRLFDMDSDGFIGELIPIWIEAGFNVCDPIEVAAGCDLPALRKKFGSNMAYRQGVDKRSIAKGQAAIEAELARLAPVLKSGGYIPGCDHGVPYDISWPNFIHYSRLLAQLTGWIK
jgi:hypothetical protein